MRFSVRCASTAKARCTAASTSCRALSLMTSARASSPTSRLPCRPLAVARKASSACATGQAIAACGRAVLL